MATFDPANFVAAFAAAWASGAILDNSDRCITQRAH